MKSIQFSILGSARDSFLAALQVKADVELVWKNCYKYNSRPVDASTRDLCAQVQLSPEHSPQGHQQVQDAVPGQTRGL